MKTASERLAKLMFDLGADEGEDMTPFHGWISPEGKHHKLEPHERHDAWLKGKGMEEHAAYSQGWVGVGHGGEPNLTIPHHVFQDKNHPANRAARRFAMSKYFPRKAVVEIKGKGSESPYFEHADMKHFGRTGELMEPGKHLVPEGVKKSDRYPYSLRKDFMTGEGLGKSEEFEKGARGDWKKEGYEIHPFTSHKEATDFVASHKSDLVDVFPENVAGKHSAYVKKDGKIVGHVQLAQIGDNLIPTALKIHKDHQRKGLASAMYSLMEDHTGYKIKGSDNQSPDAKSLWSQPKRPFGKSASDRLQELMTAFDEERLGKGARGDWEKEGYEIHYKKTQPGKSFIEEHGVNPIVLQGDHHVIVTHQGKAVGWASFTSYKNHIQPVNVEVKKEHRRKGLATAMYRHAEQSVGKKIEPSFLQSKEAESLWSQPNRPFGVKKSASDRLQELMTAFDEEDV